MKKIYNNLNIDNLMKSEWFNQFNKEQQKEIRYGLEDNLDVLIYAKPEVSWQEMKVIRDELFNKRKINKKTMRE